MRLTVFNGSPKPGKNNTEIMVEHLLRGFYETSGNSAQVVKMNNMPPQELVNLFEQSEAVLLAFPLYVYSMPGGVKEFIEALQPFIGKCKGKKLGFLVQYGFTEAIHARPLEGYLKQLVSILGCDYMGMVIKGGCDALTRMPQNATKKTLNGIYEIGRTLGESGRFDQNQLNEYAKPETQGKQPVFIMKLVLKLINKFYWEAQFKKNGVTYEGSFAKPYGQ